MNKFQEHYRDKFVEIIPQDFALKSIDAIKLRKKETKENLWTIYSEHKFPYSSDFFFELDYQLKCRFDKHVKTIEIFSQTRQQKFAATKKANPTPNKNNPFNPGLSTFHTAKQDVNSANSLQRTAPSFVSGSHDEPTLPLLVRVSFTTDSHPSLLPRGVIFLPLTGALPSFFLCFASSLRRSNNFVKYGSPIFSPVT